MIVTFCFDDCYEEVYKIAFPLFRQYRITGTLGIITELIGGSFEGYSVMNIFQIKELYRERWEIANHSATHPFLTHLTEERILNEIISSRETLKKLGFDVKTFLVPYGDYNNKVRILVSKYYSFCRPSIWGENHFPLKNKYNLKSKWVTNDSFEKIKSWIDDSILNNSWLIIMLHHIDKPEKEYNISSENLKRLLEYIKMRKIKVSNFLEITQPKLH